MNSIITAPRSKTEETELNTLSESLLSNVVSEEKLRKIQRKVLNDLASTLRKTYGPMGTNTWIIQGANADSVSSKFTKDGRSVLKKILYMDPIAMAIQDQIEEIALYTDNNVGDGTTSATLLSDAIFNQFATHEKEFTCSPQKKINIFHSLVAEIKDLILSKANTTTETDIRNICLTSTNHNEKLAEDIVSLYNEYGKDVYIDVLSSNDNNNKIKVLDGMTVDEGYSDPAYINTREGQSVISNASVYYFCDPIDTPEMIAFLEKIIQVNILEPAAQHQEVVPTVVVSPKITSDASPLIRQIIEFLKSYDSKDMTEDKPPLLLVTNIGFHSAKMDDIAMLCGCKTIRKYIDPKIQKADVEKGIAPTLENVHTFAGKCEKVVSDISNTKFINPYDMHERDEDGLTKTDENGEFVYSSTFNSLRSWLEAELKNAKENNEDANTIGGIRRRLRSLDSSMVEYYVGGISMSDIESDKALLQDAVKNCRSACEHGYGRGANMEGFESAYKVFEKYQDCKDEDVKLMSEIILASYRDIVKDLYEPVYGEDKTNAIIETSLKDGTVYDIYEDTFDMKVITSIYSDVDILSAVDKIITLLMTTNQALIQHPNLNRY